MNFDIFRGYFVLNEPLVESSVIRGVADARVRLIVAMQPIIQDVLTRNGCNDCIHMCRLQLAQP